MFSHVMVGSNDIDRAQAFYDALLGVIGAGAGMRDADDQGNVRVFYRHGDSMFCLTKPINGAPATAANGGTIGFNCRSGEQVKQFHDALFAFRPVPELQRKGHVIKNVFAGHQIEILKDHAHFALQLAQIAGGERSHFDAHNLDAAFIIGFKPVKAA